MNQKVLFITMIICAAGASAAQFNADYEIGGPLAGVKIQPDEYSGYDSAGGGGCRATWGA